MHKSHSCQEYGPNMGQEANVSIAKWASRELTKKKSLTHSHIGPYSSSKSAISAFLGGLGFSLSSSHRNYKEKNLRTLVLQFCVHCLRLALKRLTLLLPQELALPEVRVEIGELLVCSF